MARNPMTNQSRDARKRTSPTVIARNSVTKQSRGARKILVLIAAALSLVPALAPAQQYPIKPVRVVIPWPPGGSNDVVGRIVAQKLSETTGQQFVVDNRGGAAGMIGAEFVAKSAPDGYTIMIHSATHVSNPHLYGKV